MQRDNCIPSIDIHLPSLSLKRTHRKTNFLFIRALFDLQNHRNDSLHGNSLLCSIRLSNGRGWFCWLFDEEGKVVGCRTEDFMVAD